jgi:FdhD protein
MKHIPIVRCQERAREVFEDNVVSEMVIHVFINKHYVFSTSISDTGIREFLIGHLFTESYIRSPEEIVSVLDSGTRIEITLSRKFDVSEVAFERLTRLISFSCTNTSPIESSERETAVRTKASYDQNAILTLMKEFQAHGTVFRDTGGIHSCAVSDGSSFLYYTEDISRYHAVDKVIGYILDKSINPENLLLFMTGRINIDIVLKALKIGFSGIISKSAPTDKAVLVAQNHRLLLMGFVRENRCNIYHGSERVRG